MGSSLHPHSGNWVINYAQMNSCFDVVQRFHESDDLFMSFCALKSPLFLLYDCVCLCALTSAYYVFQLSVHVSSVSKIYPGMWLKMTYFPKQINLFWHWWRCFCVRIAGDYELPDNFLSQSNTHPYISWDNVPFAMMNRSLLGSQVSFHRQVCLSHTSPREVQAWTH